MNKKTVFVVGGDLRQIYAAKELTKSNTVYGIGFDSVLLDDDSEIMITSINKTENKADYIILPLPASEDGVNIWTPFSKNNISIESVIPFLKEDGMVFGGRINKDLKECFDKNNVCFTDYYDREEMSVMNAVPTAEGAVQIAMEELPKTLFRLNVLIIGLGRISKALIQILKGFGTDITVAARKYEALAWAKIMGCKAISISEISQNIENFELIYNTVPAVVLGEEELSKTQRHALIIDLASKPGGVDFDTARFLGLKTVWALSLPGKTAPESSGKIIVETIENILAERGVT